MQPAVCPSLIGIVSYFFWKTHMKFRWLAVVICALLTMPVIASAQGVIGGAQEGASKGAREGSKAALPAA
jgi:hypothetical protein